MADILTGRNIAVMRSLQDGAGAREQGACFGILAVIACLQSLTGCEIVGPGHLMIVACLQSLTGCADLEDLGICAPGCQHATADAAQPDFPSFLQPEPVSCMLERAVECLRATPAAPCGLQHVQNSQCCMALPCPSRPACNGFVTMRAQVARVDGRTSSWRQPRSLQELASMTCDTSRQDLRLLAGEGAIG